MGFETARLAGRRVVLSQHDSMDRLAVLLVTEGASLIRCPLVRVADADDSGAVRLWVQALAAGRFDRVIFLSAEGVERLLAIAGTLGLAGQVTQTLGRGRAIARGPKTAWALHHANITPDRCSNEPTERGLINCMQREILSGAQVGVQLGGEDPAADLIQFLRNRGADVFSVAPYRCVAASSDSTVEAVLDGVVRAEIDVFVFTRPAEVRRVFDVAATSGRSAELRVAFSRIAIIAAGTASLRALDQLGVRNSIAPSRRFFARNAVEALVQQLGVARVAHSGSLL